MYRNRFEELETIVPRTLPAVPPKNSVWALESPEYFNIGETSPPPPPPQLHLPRADALGQLIS